MFRLIPAPLHRLALRLAHALRKRWWRIARPRLRGCRILAFDDEGQVLLVRHSYGSGQWMTPGGGLRRGEAPLAGARRELREETGCALLDPVEVAVADEPLHGTTHAVHLIAGQAGDVLSPDGREVVEARFFATDGLPADMPRYLRARLPGWITTAKAARPASPLPAPPARPAPTG